MREDPAGHTPTSPDASPFEESAPETLRELQTAIIEVVSRLPGRISRAVELQRALGVDKKLGWQLFTFIHAEQPLAEIANVPGAASMRKVLGAAARRKVPRAVTGRAAKAFEHFENFMSEHGADRDELVTLASGLTPERDQQHELRVRKGLFRANAHVWGVQAATYVRTCVVHPTGPDAPDSDDVLVLIGYVGLQRLRRGAHLALTATVGIQDEPGAHGGAPEHHECPAPTQRIGSMQVIPEFSTHPLPAMVARTDGAGDREHELMFPPSGRAGAVTLYTSQHIRAAWSGVQSQHGVNTLVKLPTESHVMELLVPSGTTDPGTARVSVYGRRGAVERVHDLRAIDLLPQRERIAYMGSMHAPPPVPGVARHPEAVRHMLDRLGWSGTTFDVYRCTVKYPVLHSMVRVAVLVNGADRSAPGARVEPG